MIEKIDPESTLLVGLVGGFGTVVTYILYKIAPIIGKQISAKDLLPAPPPNPPLPRFLTEKKPELAENVKSMFGLK